MALSAALLDLLRVQFTCTGGTEIEVSTVTATLKVIVTTSREERCEWDSGLESVKEKSLLMPTLGGRQWVVYSLKKYLKLSSRPLSWDHIDLNFKTVFEIVCVNACLYFFLGDNARNSNGFISILYKLRIKFSSTRSQILFYLFLSKYVQYKLKRMSQPIISWYKIPFSNILNHPKFFSIHFPLHWSISKKFISRGVSFSF